MTTIDAIGICTDGNTGTVTAERHRVARLVNGSFAVNVTADLSPRLILSDRCHLDDGNGREEQQRSPHFHFT